MALVLDGTNGITFPNASVQNNAVANTAAINSLLGTNGLSPSVIPTGSVIQIVGGSTQYNSGYFSTTATSYTAVTGASISITPQFSTSKVLLNFSCIAQMTGNAQQCYYTIYKNGSNLATGTTPSGLFVKLACSSNDLFNVNFQYLDTPSTTSATTYAIYCFTTTSTLYAIWDSGAFGSGVFTFTAQEIR
jgi:hypothetical protein